MVKAIYYPNADILMAELDHIHHKCGGQFWRAEMSSYMASLGTSETAQLKEICPRGNNKVVILYFLIHDRCLLFMLELY